VAGKRSDVADAVGQETEADQVPAPAWVADRLPSASEGDLVHVRRRIITTT